VVVRQKERFGGIKAGSAFFGWLTATGMSVLLIALLAAAGVVFGVATNTTVTVDQAVQKSEQVTGTAQTAGLVGAITLLVVLLIAYYCGGYVAGRMARFNGAKQGLAVGLWGVVMALVVAAVAAIAGAQYDVFAQLNLPRLPVNEGQVTTIGLITIGAAILTSLIGAVLGGVGRDAVPPQRRQGRTRPHRPVTATTPQSDDDPKPARKWSTMNIDKDTILNLLRSNGQNTQADQAQQELPDQVDTDQHAGCWRGSGSTPPT
jgi:hypothetical protein